MAQSSSDGIADQPAGGPAFGSGSKSPRVENRRRYQFRLADSICTALRQAGHERPLPMFPDSAWQVVVTWRRNLEFVQSRQWRGAVVECRKELDAALHELIDQANTARQRLQETDDHPPQPRLHHRPLPSCHRLNWTPCGLRWRRGSKRLSAEVGNSGDCSDQFRVKSDCQDVT